MNIKKISPNSTIYKSNSLMSSIFDLTLQEQRIVLILISMVNPKQDQEFQLYKMPVEMFKRIVGLEGEGYYSKMEAIISKLMRRAFKIDDPDGGWLILNWLSSCEYKKGEGAIELEISAKLKPYLIDLKSHYTSYRLKNILPLRSGYSLRIYELLKQYEPIGERYLSLEELRQLMEIPNDEYAIYNNFKRKVILHAQKELLEKTDICFDFKEKKRARRVVGIMFFIRRNAQEEDKTIDMIAGDDTAVSEKEAIESIQDVELYQRLLRLRFAPAQAKIYLSKYNSTRLKANIDYIDIQMQRTKIENLPAYSAKIIKDDIRLQPNLFDSTVEQQPINLENGMKIELEGKIYIFNDGYISIGKKSSITTGEIKKMIREGQAKIVF